MMKKIRKIPISLGVLQ